MSSTTDGMGRNGQFANWFKGKLASLELTQADIARRLGVSTGTVSNWATARRLPDPHSCDLIADVLGVDLDLVLWQAGHRPPAIPVDPDDPKVTIHGLVDRINWGENPDNLANVEGLLRLILDRQRVKTGG
jgi:transcriptional regulator with XRE-family HTH domain